MNGILEAPGVPADISRFTSNELFGQLGIYPDGPSMVPAGGEPMNGPQAAALISNWGGLAEECFSSAEMASVTQVPQLQVALAVLAVGPAAPLLDALLGGDTHLNSVGVGPLAQVGRVLGDPASGAVPGVRWLNERYASEHPAVVAPSLAHAICHHDGKPAASNEEPAACNEEPAACNEEPAACNAEEATLHGVLAATHAWLVASDPALADLGTELSRRQASLTITLLNARNVGSAVPSISCPDGPGTIPGGNPDLQCPDLWSIPFTQADPSVCDLDIPSPVARTLSLLSVEGAPQPPDSYSDVLGDWLATHTLGGTLNADVVERAGAALGLWAS